jgi:hypothetical protein
MGAQSITNDQVVAMPCTMLAADDNPSHWFRSSSACDAFNHWSG